MALERDKNNLSALVEGMKDSDSGIRYWSVVGLRLLEKDAASAVGVFQKALQDKSHEVRIMAAWSLIKLGKKDIAFTCLNDLLANGTNVKLLLYNSLDWMGDDALDLILAYLKTNPKDPDDKYGKRFQDTMKMKYLPGYINKKVDKPGKKKRNRK